MAVLELNQVVLHASRRSGSQGIDLQLEAGAPTIVYGPEGSGKDMLAWVALGIRTAEAGTVRLFGQDLAQLDASQRRQLRGRCGVLLDRVALLSNLSVRGNLALPLHYRGRLSEADVYARVDAMLERWELAELASLRPSSLSPGLARLAAICRLLLQEPELAVLLDPQLFQDADAQDVVRAMIAALSQQGCAVLVITHSEAFACTLEGRQLVLDSGTLKPHPGVSP